MIFIINAWDFFKDFSCSYWHKLKHVIHKWAEIVIFKDEQGCSDKHVFERHLRLVSSHFSDLFFFRSFRQHSYESEQIECCSFVLANSFNTEFQRSSQRGVQILVNREVVNYIEHVGLTKRVEEFFERVVFEQSGCQRYCLRMAS